MPEPIISDLALRGMGYEPEAQLPQRSRTGWIDLQNVKLFLSEPFESNILFNIAYFFFYGLYHLGRRFI